MALSEKLGSPIMENRVSPQPNIDKVFQIVFRVLILYLHDLPSIFLQMSASWRNIRIFSRQLKADEWISEYIHHVSRDRSFFFWIIQLFVFLWFELRLKGGENICYFLIQTVCLFFSVFLLTSLLISLTVLFLIKTETISSPGYWGNYGDQEFVKF